MEVYVNNSNFLVLICFQIMSPVKNAWVNSLQGDPPIWDPKKFHIGLKPPLLGTNIVDDFGMSIFKEKK